MLLPHVPRIALSLLDSSFHPTLTLASLQPVQQLPSNSSCTLGVTISLPDDIFIDPNELQDKWSSGGPEWYISPPVVDLERAVIPRAPGLELDLAYGPFRREWIRDTKWELKSEIPLHARYPAPSSKGFIDVHVLPLSYGPEAIVRAGWICNDGHEVELPWPKGYLHPVTVHDPLILRLPTGRHEDQQLVEAITIAVVWLAFGWVAYKLWAFGRQKGKKE